MFTGYFTLGGNEVGNSARALGYARTADCPVNWLRDRDCGGLTEALYDPDYEYVRIDQAPWYDPDDPEVTSRFLGLYVVSISGLSDSTRTATVTEKNTDGAQVSGYRHTARDVRVRAMLTAKGMDALEAGMTWLRNALEPNACGMHGNVDCGASDMGFFVDCPPVRALVPTYSEWTEVRRNLFKNPRATSTSATYWGTPANGTLSLISDMSGPITTGVRLTRNATGAAAMRVIVGATMPDDGANVHVYSRVRPSTAITLQVVARPAITSATNQVQLGPLISIGAGEEYVVDLNEPSFTVGASGANSGIVYLWSTGAIGQTVDFSTVDIEAQIGLGYMDGDLVDTDLDRYSWVGAVGLSESFQESRVLADAPETDDVYNARVDWYKRYLHTVTCVSGPLIQQEFVSSDKTTVGYLVEFSLLAATPAVYGVTKEVELNPTTPTVLQDTEFNLVQTPSATLAYGTIVGATNYSPNPSVEVNATDWVGTADIVSGSSPAAYLSSGRVTGELQATGTASFRGRILGNGSTAVNGRAYIWLRQTVPLVGLPNASRMSFNIWAAVAILAGASASTINGIQVTAVWRTGTTVLSTITIGNAIAADYGGRAYQLDSQLKPNAADNALIQVRADVTWASSATPANNSDIRAYADALAVTLP